MSTKLVDAIQQFREIRGTNKRVLSAIARYCDDDGKGAWPSVATIAKDTDCSERTVQYACRVLQKRGLLWVEYGNGDHGCNRYTVRAQMIYKANGCKSPEATRLSGPARGANSAPNSSGYNRRILKRDDQRDKRSDQTQYSRSYSPILDEMTRRARERMTDDEFDASFDEDMQRRGLE